MRVEADLIATVRAADGPGVGDVQRSVRIGTTVSIGAEARRRSSSLRTSDSTISTDSLIVSTSRLTVARTTTSS